MAAEQRMVQDEVDRTARSKTGDRVRLRPAVEQGTHAPLVWTVMRRYWSPKRGIVYDLLADPAIEYRHCAERVLSPVAG